MEDKNIFNMSRELELETQLIINQKLYEMNVIDSETSQAFTNYILPKLQKVQMA